MQVSVALLPVLILPLFALPQEPPDPPLPSVFAPAQKAGEKFQVSGTVSDAVTGAPIRRALVTLDRYPPPQRSTFTGEDGRFSFTGLDEANYRISVERPGYFLDSAFDATRSFRLGSSLSGHDFKLTPLAAVTGIVTNSDGEPIPGLEVEVFALSISGGYLMPASAGSGQTDDRGAYRVAGLHPGRYLVAARGAARSLMYIGDGNPVARASNSYGVTFYPQARERASATKLTLAPGETFQADFALAAQEGFSVRGKVHGVTYGDGAWVSLKQLTGEDAGGRAHVNAVTGSFEILNAAAGNYIVEALARPNDGNGSVRVGRREIHVVDRNIEGLDVSFVEPVHIGLAVRRANLTAAGSPDVSGIQVMLQPEPPRLSGMGPVDLPLDPPSQNDADRPEIHPGRYFVDISLSARPLDSGGGAGVPTEYIDRIVSGQVDLLADGLTVASGAAVPPIEIYLRAGGGTLSGRVEPNEAVNGRRRLLLLREVGSNVVPATADLPNSGEFTVGPLAPGEYLVWAWDGDEVIEYRNPQDLAIWRDKALRVTVREGANERLELTAIRGGRQ